HGRSARPIAHHGRMSSDLVAPVEAAAPAAPLDVVAAVDTDAIPLTRNRDFRAFVIAEGISAIGDAVSFTALPLLVLALTGSGFAMGIVGALQSLPDLVFGLVAGAIADRSNQKRMMVLSDL